MFARLMAAAIMGLVIAGSVTVHASIVERDLLAAGDGLITQDTDTGLGWLDMTESTNLSVNDVLGGAGNFLSDGFNYATEAQIRTFWTNAGIPTFNTNATTPGADAAGRVSENFAPVVALMELIGCTGNCTSGGPDFTQGKAALNEQFIGSVWQRPGVVELLCRL